VGQAPQLKTLNDSGCGASPSVRWGMIRKAGFKGVWGLCWAGIVWLFVLLAAAAAQADGLVNLPAEENVIDLSVHGTRVAAQRRNLQLEVPGEADNQRAVLELRGEGAGPVFDWTVYTFRNAGPERRAFILAVDAQRFAASGIVNLQPYGTQLVSVQWLSQSVEHVPQISATGDAFRFELNPAQSITVGLEGKAVLSGVRIYDAQAFAQREASLAFLRGAAMAVAFVLALSILALYGIRANRAFLVGGFLGFASLMVMALEAGYFGTSGMQVLGKALSLQQIRAFVESVFALACGLLLWGLTTLNRRRFRDELPFWLLLVGLVILMGSSFVSPTYVTQTARWAVALLTIAGFVASVRARRSSAEVMDNATLFWCTLLVWVFLAAVAIVEESPSSVWHAVLLVGLTLMLGVLAFACLRLAFAQGFLSKPYLTDSSRRSLALTGAQHYLWDWQPQENVLEIGVDLARSLGSTSKLSPTSAARWFAALVHPADEMAFRKCLDLRSLKAGDFVEQELRLRDVNGEYHWFALRARALPGPRGIPARLIGTLTDITRNKKTEDKLISEAIHDPVTGLPTRALFLDRAEREVAKPMALPHHILMIGIERFKILNEGLGHDLGDQLLMAVGQRIADCLTSNESVARTTGTSFAVMHVDVIDGRDAMTLANAILAALAKPINILSQDVYLSACIGISLRSGPGVTAVELQQQAEAALHEAQAQGPRSIVAFHDQIEDERADNVALESDLRRAINQREIEVHYQPIMDLMTREIVGLEALARWRHPARGLLTPVDFISMAEQAGILTEISEIVMSEAVRQIGIWQRVLTRNRPIYMAINVSADQLSDTRFLDRLTGVLAREGALPYAIKIEITESVVMRYPERARQLVQRLRTLGVGVACDDFGTGFSNLASLRELAFDTLKMDRSFLTGEGLDGRGSVILQSVVNMAHSLGMAVVAEGIENEEHIARLIALGCELGQGFALCPAKTAREIHGLLAVLPVVANGEQPKAPVSQIEETAIPELRPQGGVDLQTEDEPVELPSLFSVYAKRAREGIPEPKQPRAGSKRKRTSSKSASKKTTGKKKR
jgi:diguanylate cyclase (GGDEF)-like protein